MIPDICNHRHVSEHCWNWCHIQLMSHTNAGLQIIMGALNDAGNDYGMNIDRKKTTLMRMSKQPGKVVKLFIDGYQMEQVSSFCYPK